MLSPGQSNPPHIGFFESEGKSEHNSLGTFPYCGPWEVQPGGHQLQAQLTGL